MTASFKPSPFRVVTTLALALGLSACAGGLFGGGDKKKTPTVGERVPILSRIESGAKVDEDTIVKVYEGAVELEAEEQSLGGVDKGVGAKGIVEAVLARLAIENAG